MKKQHLYIFLAVALLAAAVYFFKARFPSASSDFTVRVAANYPMTGELAFYGSELRDGMLLAMAEQRLTIAPEADFEFDWGDNKFNAKDAVTVMQRQLAGQPTIYASALKPQVMAIENEISAKGIPHLAWVLDLTPNPTNTENNFRSWVSFKLECDVFVEYAKKNAAKKVVLCFLSLPSTEEAYGKYLQGRLRDELNCSVKVESYNPNVSAADYPLIAARVANEKADLTLINGFIPNIVGMIRSLRPLGAIGDGTTIAALDMLDAADALQPSESEGIIVAGPEFLVKPNAAQKNWAERFKSRYGRMPSYHAAYAYDAGLVLLHAASSRPSDSKQWLEKILSVSEVGVTGQIKFGPDKSLLTKLYPAIYRKGKLVPLE